MIEELHSASEQLRTTLERYLRVCSSIQNACLHGITPHNIPPQYARQIDRELNLAKSYDSDIGHAILALKTTRNHAFSIAPINSLPPEILTRIFHIARNDEPWHINRITVVCSRWRSVSLSTCSLWTKIDYRPNGSDWRYRGLLVQAQLRASRSGQLPLDVVISGSSELYAKYSYDTQLIDFCRTIAPRIQYLELDLKDFHNTPWSDNGEHSVFTTFLTHCEPGVLTKLVTTDIDRFSFIMTKEDVYIVNSFLKVGLQDSYLETLLTPIKVLHLTGLFPRWTSLAYSGLVDLRLSPARGGHSYLYDVGSISESELISILRASPRLRILHFGLRITDQLKDDVVEHRRVGLAELEVLRVGPGPSGYSFDNIESTFKLLEPGTRPLSTSIINCDSYEDYVPRPTETSSFFARSNITKLYATDVPQLLELLTTLPHLKVLVLSEQTTELGSLLSSTSDYRGGDRPAGYPRLDICFLLGCQLLLGEIVVLVQHCRPQTLILYDNTIYRNFFEEEAGTDVVRNELSTICQDVRITDNYPSLAAHRDLLEN